MTIKTTPPFAVAETHFCKEVIISEETLSTLLEDGIPRIVEDTVVIAKSIVN